MDAQPGDHRARGQAFLLGGVELPDLVDDRRARPPLRRRPACGSGRGVEAAQPALQRPLAGQGAFGEERPQLDADAARAPKRVLAAQVEDALAQQRMVVGPGRAAAVVAGLQRVVAGGAHLQQQVSDGARVQLQLLGDLIGVLALLAALKDGSANSGRDGERHDRPP